MLMIIGMICQKLLNLLPRIIHKRFQSFFAATIHIISCHVDMIAKNLFLATKKNHFNQSCIDLIQTSLLWHKIQIQIFFNRCCWCLAKEKLLVSLSTFSSSSPPHFDLFSFLLLPLHRSSSPGKYLNFAIVILILLVCLLLFVQL